MGLLLIPHGCAGGYWAAEKVVSHLSVGENLLRSVCVVSGKEFFKNEIERNEGCIGCRQMCVLYVSFGLCKLCLPPAHCRPSPTDCYSSEVW